MKFPNLKRHIAMLFVGMLYGSNYPIVKISTPEFIKPFGFIVFRVVIATAIFWILGLFVKEKINWKEDRIRLILCALFGVGINMLFFFKGVSLTSATNGSIIMTLTPIMVFVISLILLKEKITNLKIIGLVTGLIGALILIYKPEGTLTQGDWRGDVLVLLNAMSYGTYLVLAKPLLNKYNPITITKWIFLIGIVFTLPVGYQEAVEVEWSSFTPAVYFSFIYVIIGVTILAYIINIWAMRKVNPTTVGVYIYVQPVFAILVATLFFEEAITLRHIIASLLVFAGVAMVIKR